jgi:hypothetical protein
MVLFMPYDIEKSYVNAEMPAEKSYSGISISSGSQLPQSGISIPASGFSPVPLVSGHGLVRHCPAMPITTPCSRQT